MCPSGRSVTTLVYYILSRVQLCKSKELVKYGSSLCAAVYMKFGAEQKKRK